MTALKAILSRRHIGEREHGLPAALEPKGSGEIESGHRLVRPDCTSRWAIHGHGGRIWVESRPGKGSTFHFTLPERQQEAP